MNTNEKIKSVVDDYNEIAQDYADEFYGSSEYERYLDAFLEGLVGKKILDAGCGCGNDCRYAFEKGFNVVAIDLSEKMISIAKQNLPQIDFQVMNMSDLEFESSTFDGIISNCSLFHVPKELLGKTIEEFCRVLKRDGKLFIVTTEGNGEQMQKEPFRTDKKVYVNFLSKQELQSLLKKNGFKINQIIAKPVTTENGLSTSEYVIMAEKN